jgi:bis(5'-nucleosidyl)-tetraphosphatase
MKYEQSYGAVVYKIEDGQIYLLIEFMTLGHVSLPKGHIEEGETPLLCTIREIKEETNLDVEVDMKSFSKTITYSPKPDVQKDVTFYLAKPISSQIIVQPEEVKEAKWMTPEEAVHAVTFETDRETLKEAIPVIQNILNAQK